MYRRLEGSLFCTLLWQSSLMSFTLGIKCLKFDGKAAYHTKGEPEKVLARIIIHATFTLSPIYMSLEK